MLKIKALAAKKSSSFPTHVYYVPNLSKDEAGIIGCGHHSMMDGLN